MNMNWYKIKSVAGVTFAVFLALVVASLSAVAIVRLVDVVEAPQSIPYQTFHVLLAGASFAMLFFSVVVALAGVFGWREIKEIIGRKVEEATKQSAKHQTGLIRLSTGVMYGRLAREEIGEEIEIVSRGLLSEAIDSTSRAYEILIDAGDDWDEIKAANNLAFYYALEENDKNALTAIELAKKVKNYHKFAGDADLIDTYCRVIAVYWQFFDEPGDKLERAIEMSEGVRGWKEASLEEKKQARRTVKRLRRAQRELAGGE